MIVGFDKVELNPQVGGAGDSVLNEVPIPVAESDIVPLAGGGTITHPGGTAVRHPA